MDYSHFYDFGSDLKSYCLQVSATEIRDEIPFVYGEVIVTHPVVFRYHSGGRVYDLVETGWASLYLLSDRVISALHQHQITGWKTYPATVYDKKSNLVPGFSIFAVTGRAGPIDNSMSEIIQKDPPVPEGNPYQVRKGRYFDLSTWDGSDIFILKNSLAIVVTEKVKNVLAPLKPKNIRLQPITDIERGV
jgi:hypothetical protein